VRSKVCSGQLQEFGIVTEHAQARIAQPTENVPDLATLMAVIHH
jgi:hypothetical protein